MMEIICDPSLRLLRRESGHMRACERPPMDWRLSLDLDADALRTVDPLPIVLEGLMDLHGLHAHREHLLIILTEIFTIALEQGVLELDPRMKGLANGFAEILSTATPTTQ